MLEIKKVSETKAYEQLAALFGEENFFPDVFELPEVRVIRTPSPALDRAIGVGGWPRGKFIQVAGAESSGKTMLTLLTIADWQKEDPENCAIFIDAEYTYDPKWAAKLGVDNERVILIKTNEAAKIVQGLVGKITVNKKGKESKAPGLLDFVANGQKMKYKSATGRVCSFNLGKVGVVVLDSVAAIQTPTEKTSAVGKQNMALMARFLSVELKKLTPELAHADVVMLAINQVRVDLGKMFGDPTSTSGGKALKHACSLMVEVALMKGKDSIVKNSQEEIIGGEIAVKITKNKVAAPFKKCIYAVRFNKGIVNKERELLETGLKCGAITKPTVQKYLIGEHEVTYKKAAWEYIRENYDEVDNFVREFYLSNYEPPELEDDEEDEDEDE